MCCSAASERKLFHFEDLVLFSTLREGLFLFLLSIYLDSISRHFRLAENGLIYVIVVRENNAHFCYT